MTVLDSSRALIALQETSGEEASRIGLVDEGSVPYSRFSVEPGVLWSAVV